MKRYIAFIAFAFCLAPLTYALDLSTENEQASRVDERPEHVSAGFQVPLNRLLIIIDHLKDATNKTALVLLGYMDGSLSLVLGTDNQKTTGELAKVLEKWEMEYYIESEFKGLSYQSIMLIEAVNVDQLGTLLTLANKINPFSEEVVDALTEALKAAERYHESATKDTLITSYLRDYLSEENVNFIHSLQNRLYLTMTAGLKLLTTRPDAAAQNIILSVEL